MKSAVSKLCVCWHVCVSVHVCVTVGSRLQSAFTEMTQGTQFRVCSAGLCPEI